MERCERLEEISDKIRCGEPVGLLEAIAAIDYQTAMRADREYRKWYRRVWRWVTHNAELKGAALLRSPG